MQTGEDREVAEILNRDFISIKVDREERPGIYVRLSGSHRLRRLAHDDPDVT